jgi:2-alkyl-3-oxoalkanoate reductase
MHLLITGGSGFLGSHIVQSSLKEGHTVRALVRPTSDTSFLQQLSGVEICTGDLTKPRSLHAATQGIDVVIHAAARVLDYGPPEQFFQTNVLGTQQLLEQAKKNGARSFVFVSSPSVTMVGRDQLHVDEQLPYPARYLNLYSRTKAQAEQWVLEQNSEAFTTCALRPRGIWGPRDWRGFIPKILARIRAQRLPNMSGGRPLSASLCHCRNAAHACVLAAASSRVGGKAYFITDEEVVNVWDFANEMAQRFSLPPVEKTLSPRLAWILGSAFDAWWSIPFLAPQRSPPLSRYAVALLTHSYTYNTEAARRDFDYAPVVSQAAGLAELETWVEEIGGLDAFLKHIS